MADGLNVTTPEEVAPTKKPGLHPRTRTILYSLGAVLALIWLFGDPPVYFAKSIHGQVIDDSTGKPLSGVVIVAEWLLESNISAEPSMRVSLKTMETISDENGRYEFEEWGPRIRPPGLAFIARDPELTYLKPRYFTQTNANDLKMIANRSRSAIRASIFDGQIVRLKPFDGDWHRYWIGFEGGWSLNWGCTYDCPRFVAGMLDESDFIVTHAPKELKLFRLVHIDELPSGLRSKIEGLRTHEN